MSGLPSQLNIFNLYINTFGVFLLFGFFLMSFIIWKEGKKDGFEEERLFDILITSSVSAVFLSRAFFAINNSVTASALINRIVQVWTPGFNPLGALIGFMLPLFLLCRTWNWSFYRIVDIFSIGMSLGLSVITLGFVGVQSRFEFLFAFAAWIFVFAILTKFRNTKLSSGYGFSLFLLVNAILWYFFLGIGNSLIFFITLVTLSAVVFLFRWSISHDKTIKRLFRKN